MKKVIIAAGVLWFLMRKKADATPTNPTDEPAPRTINIDAVVAVVKDSFADNDIRIDNGVLSEIKAQLTTATQSDLATLLNYFAILNDGGVISEKLKQDVDAIAPKFSQIFIPIGLALRTSRTDVQYRLIDDGGANDGLSDVWQVIDQLQNFLPQGRVLIGLAHAIGDLFCGRKCKLRRAERAANG